MFLHRNQGEKMKKITFLMIVATILFVGCSEKEEKESKELAAEAAVKAFDGAAEASTAIVDDIKEKTK
jgi:PBP1b-binding outer membrane lipoprotein LpoB